MVALVEALEGFKDWNLSLQIEDKRSNSLGNGAKKLLTNADLGSNPKTIVIDSMKTYHQSQQEKYKREEVKQKKWKHPLAMGVEASESAAIKSLILMKKIFKRKDNR
ncbi:hypothetical protein HpBGD38_02690 [Helicobacter pylori]